MLFIILRQAILMLVFWMTLALPMPVLGAGLAGDSLPEAGPARPNIILILADDLGIGDLGCYGQQKIHTPHLDQMAKEGIRFTRFYAGTTVCAPSRASLLTGLHTGHTAVRGNKEYEPEGQHPLPDSAITIAEVMKAAGYATGCFGKWGLGFVGSPGDPLRQGFDRFFGYNCQRQSHNYFPDHLWDNDNLLPLPNTREDQEVYAADLIQTKALAFIHENRLTGKNQRQPFFLYLAYTLPHAALQTPKTDSFFVRYQRAFAEQPNTIPSWNGRGYQPQAYPHAAYAAMVSRLDAYVGQVLAALQQAGIDNNTLVLFSSDNGPHHEGGNDPSFFGSSAGSRGMKRDLYEGGIRTPLIARWPGKIGAAGITDVVAAAWDLMPTLSAIALTDSPTPATDGISLLPALSGKKIRSNRYFYWEFHEEGGKQALRKGKWKALRLKVNAPRNTEMELYDLLNDPGETVNLARRHPVVLKKLTKQMDKAHLPNPDFPLGPEPKSSKP